MNYLKKFDELTPDDIRCPPHPQPAARRIIESGRLCQPEDHEWIDLDGYEWRECRRCNIADVTAADVGQPIDTPEANE